MRTFYIIALLLWILGSTYISNKTFCGDKKAKKPAATAAGATSAAATKNGCDLSLEFDDSDFSDFTASIPTNVVFKTNESSFQMPKNKLADYKEVFSQTAKYLSDNTDRSLLLEGIYFENETNSTDMDNLGLARANSMKDHFIDNYKVDEQQLKIGGRLTSNLDCYYNKDSQMVTKGIIATFGEL